MKNLIITAVFCFVIGVLVGFGVSALRAKSRPASQSASGAQENLSLQPQLGGVIASQTNGKNEVEANDQPAGSLVGMAKVVFEHPGWVAVHEDRQGAPGNILGAHWYPEGEQSSAEVELLRPLISEGTYYAMLHTDNGDKLFDKSTDVPLTDSSGNPIMVKFKAE